MDLEILYAFMIQRVCRAMSVCHDNIFNLPMHSFVLTFVLHSCCICLLLPVPSLEQVLVYDPSDAASLDMLAGIKSDIDKNKEKKEVSIVVIANIRRLPRTPNQSPEKQSPEKKTQDPIELILNRANSWCARERIKHYTVNALERASLYEPFVSLAVRLHPPQTKSTFPQLSKLTQKSSKADS